MAVTIRDVAKLAGVSTMTVSRVVNGSPSVTPDTRARVEAAIAELRFVPNTLARGLSRHRSGTIGMVVPDLGDPFFTLILRGAEQVARASGYRVIVCNPIATTSGIGAMSTICRQAGGRDHHRARKRSLGRSGRADDRSADAACADRPVAAGILSDIVQAKAWAERVCWWSI